MITHPYPKDLLSITDFSLSTLFSVFDILLNFTKTRDWSQALAVGVPRRKGFVAHSNTLSNDQRDDHNNTHGNAHINAHSKENSNNHSNAHGNKESYSHSNEVT